MADKSKKISEREIKVIKNRVSSTSLFADKPEEFRLMMKYVKNLEFDRKPDYQYLRNLLKSIRVKNCLIGIGFEFPIGHKKIIIKSKSIHSEKHRKSHRLRHSLDEEEKSDSVLQPKRSVSSYETCQLTVRTDFDGKCV